MRAPKKLSANAQRRADARDAEKRGRLRERLARSEPGGDPARPIDVPSASVVEVLARAVRCPRCLGACNVVEHAAETWAEQRLRVARTRCATCGAVRSIYFRIVPSAAN